VADAYHEVQKGRSRIRDQRTRDLFDEIIDGSPEDVAGLEHWARLAGLDVGAVLRAVVVRDAPEERHGSSIGELPPVPLLVVCAESAGVDVERIIAARRASELLLIFPWWTGDLRRLREGLGDALRRLLGDPALSRAGVSGAARGAGDLRRAYLECVRANELGAILRPEASVHCYDDYVLDDVFDSTATQGERLIEQTLGPLLELGKRGERLVETLGAYFRAGLNHKVAAASVDVHRNTLTHRLEQIRRATGLDLEDPAERLRVETALRFLELRKLHDRE
jgi:sugar diacid utilization regulator